MIDCSSFMRYNGESSTQLLPLDSPDQGSTHLDALRPIPGFNDSDSDSDSDSDGFTLPALQLMRRLANKANRKFASSGKKAEGEYRDSHASRAIRVTVRLSKMARADSMGQQHHFPSNSYHFALLC